MPTKTPRRFVTARIIANLGIVFVGFAIAIPSCFVVETSSHPAGFYWLGLLPTAIFSGAVTWAIWSL